MKRNTLQRAVKNGERVMIDYGADHKFMHRTVIVKRGEAFVEVGGCNVELCPKCLKEAELDNEHNEHNDYGHATKVAGCPQCEAVTA